ncbi:MAG: beta-N-acetylhexosaminidase [Rhodocyclaceae bacterium]
MLDVAGTELTDEERITLSHPLVGGVILFTRNYASPEQLAALTAEIHALRAPPLLVAVDHEGGRVQRFREGFTRLPPMRALGALWDSDRNGALRAARAVGHVLAAELRACGVDLSFTPVLDLDHGPSGVIGDRAFHRDPAVVTTLANALIDGLAEAGMSSVGKHFPGHGFVAADSHLALPVDNRSYAVIAADDLEPFQKLIPVLGGVMPAHIIFDQVDARYTAGFSPSWLQVVLRQRLGFRGAVFSDDLSMEGASVAGDVVARATAAVLAGCDMVLVCNAPAAARDLLARWRPATDSESPRRIHRLVPTAPAPDFATLRRRDAYIGALRTVASVPALAAGERATRA